MIKWLYTTYVVISVLLCFLILVQQGKGADAGPAFSDTIGPSFMSSKNVSRFFVKLTIGLAFLYLIISMVLNLSP
jgi:preprotein translocase subunit SecG